MKNGWKFQRNRLHNKSVDVQNIVLIIGRWLRMLAVNYTNLRDNMKKYMDKVTDDYETMIVTRKDKNQSR